MMLLKTGGGRGGAKCDKITFPFNVKSCHFFSLAKDLSFFVIGEHLKFQFI